MNILVTIAHTTALQGTVVKCSLLTGHVLAACAH